MELDIQIWLTHRIASEVCSLDGVLSKTVRLALEPRWWAAPFVARSVRVLEFRQLGRWWHRVVGGRPVARPMSAWSSTVLDRVWSRRALRSSG